MAERSSQPDDELDPVFKALADRHRRLVLDLLLQQPGLTLVQLCAQLNATFGELTRQAVAKHLAVLGAAGLVVTVRRGREKLHYLNPVPINRIHDRWISRYQRDALSALAELKANLEGTSDDRAHDRADG
jgi:DNA-binding transcriptional ArsR family regulator